MVTLYYYEENYTGKKLFGTEIKSFRPTTFFQFLTNTGSLQFTAIHLVDCSKLQWHLKK